MARVKFRGKLFRTRHANYDFKTNLSVRGAFGSSQFATIIINKLRMLFTLHGRNLSRYDSFDSSSTHRPEKRL